MASGDADGVIKLWDLQAGKLMKELPGHSGAVNALEFHPSECLLASGSADKTIRFWDVEKFELVSASEPDAGNVKCILFYPETEGVGNCCIFICIFSMILCLPADGEHKKPGYTVDKRDVSTLSSGCKIIITMIRI